MSQTTYETHDEDDPGDINNNPTKNPYKTTYLRKNSRMNPYKSGVVPGSFSLNDDEDSLYMSPEIKELRNLETKTDSLIPQLIRSVVFLKIGSTRFLDTVRKSIEKEQERISERKKRIIISEVILTRAEKKIELGV
ncbi:MAG: hypothetical protein ABIJ92_01800 [Candidatus Aenigmatarchaeota archaeon]